jgi:hypothetical protein
LWPNPALAKLGRGTLLVSEDEELAALAEGFEGVEEDGAGVVVVEVREAVVTTER